jgi:hypothetical protein
MVLPNRPWKYVDGPAVSIIGIMYGFGTLGVGSPTQEQGACRMGAEYW